MQALYQAAYTRLTDVLSPSQFPRVTNWPVSKLPEGRLCEALYDYAALTVTWPDWNNPPPATTSDTNSDTAAAGAAAAAGCHRVDESSGTVDFALYAGGDLDAMCFACVCSLGLPSLDDSEASTGEDEEEGAAAGVGATDPSSSAAEGSSSLAGDYCDRFEKDQAVAKVRRAAPSPCCCSSSCSAAASSSASSSYSFHHLIMKNQARGRQT
jgi:hypothetical protein